MNLYIINEESQITRKFYFYYFIPYWILKKIKSFKSISIINDKICTYFSIEKISELIRFKETVEMMEKEKKIRMSNTDLLQINNNKFENNSSNKNIK